MAKKLTIKGLERMIKEEVKNYEADLEKKAKETKKVEADEYADTLEKKIDYEKAAKISPKVESFRRKDALLRRRQKKALQLAESFRNKRVALRKSLKKKVKSNRRKRK